jgi:hypothetical protein
MVYPLFGKVDSVSPPRWLYTYPCGIYEILEGFIWRMRSLSDVAEAWWDAGGDLSAQCQNREEHSPLDIHNSGFGRVLVIRVGVWLFDIWKVII